MTTGIGRGVSHVYASHFNRVVVNGIRLEVIPGLVRLYTDDKHYKIVIDGEIVRRQGVANVSNRIQATARKTTRGQVEASICDNKDVLMMFFCY